LIKDQFQSFLKDSSEAVIRLLKGDDILESDTPIAKLFNTRAEALKITIIGEKGIKWFYPNI
jgi:hypothetical protein